MSRRVYIALFAVLAELIIVGAAGNQWTTKYVAQHEAKSPLGDMFLRSVPSFPWRFSPQSGTGASTILIAEFAGIVALFVLTFVLIVILLRGAESFSGAFFVAWVSVIVAALIAQMVTSVVDFNYVGRSQHLGLGRVGFALFNSNDGLTVMFALMCGLVCAIVAGVVGAILRTRTDEPEPESTLFAPGGLAGTPPPYNPPPAPGTPGTGYDNARTESFAAAPYGSSPQHATEQFPPVQPYGSGYGAGYASNPGDGYGSGYGTPPEQQPTGHDPYRPPLPDSGTPAQEASPAQEPPPVHEAPPVPEASPVQEAPASQQPPAPPSHQAATTTVFAVPPVPQAPPGDPEVGPAEGRDSH